MIIVIELTRNGILDNGLIIVIELRTNKSGQDVLYIGRRKWNLLVVNLEDLRSVISKHTYSFTGEGNQGWMC